MNNLLNLELRSDEYKKELINLVNAEDLKIGDNILLHKTLVVDCQKGSHEIEEYIIEDIETYDYFPKNKYLNIIFKNGHSVELRKKGETMNKLVSGFSYQFITYK